MTWDQVREEAAQLLEQRRLCQGMDADFRVTVALYLSGSERGEGLRVAEKLAITPQHLSDIRNGRRSFTDARLELIAAKGGRAKAAAARAKGKGKQ
jgi:hypothetical protein